MITPNDLVYDRTIFDVQEVLSGINNPKGALNVDDLNRIGLAAKEVFRLQSTYAMYYREPLYGYSYDKEFDYTFKTDWDYDYDTANILSDIVKLEQTLYMMWSAHGNAYVSAWAPVWTYHLFPPPCTNSGHAWWFDNEVSEVNAWELYLYNAWNNLLLMKEITNYMDNDIYCNDNGGLL